MFVRIHPKVAELLTEQERQIPIVGECHVCVIGDGLAGRAAAFAAARIGADVIFLDQGEIPCLPMRHRVLACRRVYAAAAEVRDDRIRHIMYECDEGRRAVEVRAVVDTTDTLRIARAAGERVVSQRKPLKGMRLVGQNELTDVCCDCKFEDAVGSCVNPADKNSVFWLPLSALYGRRVRNLICAGRGVSAVGVAAEAMRSDEALELSGRAAGVAASMLGQEEVREFSEIEMEVFLQVTKRLANELRRN